MYNLHPKCLDCTIRDGGYVNNWKFTEEQVKNCYDMCNKTGVDYMEIGFRNIKNPQFLEIYGDTFFCDEEYINRVIDNLGTCKIAVMVTINEFNISDFLPKNQSKISMVRILMAYHGSKNKSDDVLDLKLLEDGISQTKQLIDLGYEVSFNIGRIDKMSFEQINTVALALNKTNISHFTMADTYGSVDLNYIENLIPFVRSVFDNKIKLGFHAHDNCSNATSKALYSLKFGIDMIDGCILGYGRGSGNAKTELILMDFNKNYGKNYDFINIIEFGDENLINYKECLNNLCYNVVYALCSYYGCHVTYAIEIIEKYDKMNVKKINTFFKNLKENNKNMFFWNELLINFILDK
jgi:4-hydroxy 2-oxovalerate aldolase